MKKNIINNFLTCSGKTDGPGAQIHALLSTMLYAREFNCQYVHTPFKVIAHNNGNDEWGKKWENFFNMGKGEIKVNEIKDKPLEVIKVDKPADLCMKSNTLNIIPHCHKFADKNPDLYSNMTDIFIEKYLDSSKENYKSFYEPGKINIAVHVRRGDVVNWGPWKKRYTANPYYKSLLQRITSILEEFNVGVSIQLYSQGLIEDFKELNGLGIKYQLDECPFTTFFNLTAADILIMSKSSFSYSAALLSKSIKIYEPFWHKPISDWIVTSWKNKQVEFDYKLLRKKIENQLNDI